MAAKEPPGQTRRQRKQWKERFERLLANASGIRVPLIRASASPPPRGPGLDIEAESAAVRRQQALKVRAAADEMNLEVSWFLAVYVRGCTCVACAHLCACL